MTDRRRGRRSLGAHPERRSVAPRRREALRRRRALGRAAAVVLPPVLNLHARAAATSPVVSQAVLGTGVTVLETRPGWALVETPDRYRGWSRTRALRPQSRGRAGNPQGSGLCEVGSLLANIYRDPDVTSAAPIATAPMLARLAVLRRSGDWLRVRLPDGRFGWLQRGDVRRPARQNRRAGPDPGAVAATALRFLGLPYLWGGTTTFGLDCSGLVQTAWRAHGVVLPRDADLQWFDPRLAAVRRGGVRAGDLLFFGPDPGAITHVGIALGRSAFVNATTCRTPAVRIDRLDDPYWRRLFRGARRFAAGTGDPGRGRAETARRR